VRRQTYGYLPSRRTSPPFDRYQLILFGNRSTCVWTTCLRLLPESGTAGSRIRQFRVASPSTIVCVYMTVNKECRPNIILWNKPKHYSHDLRHKFYLFHILTICTCIIFTNWTNKCSCVTAIFRLIAYLEDKFDRERATVHSSFVNTNAADSIYCGSQHAARCSYRFIGDIW